MMSEIRGVLLDVDGTLLDTREYIYLAVEHATRVHGFPTPTREHVGKAVGRMFDDFYEYVLGVKIDFSPIQKTHHEFQLAHPELSKAFPNVVETLRMLKLRGIKLGAVTNRRRKTAEPTLHAANLYELFDVSVCGDDIEFNKPDPRHLLSALESLHLPPEAAVMVGDTDIDIEAGRRAGTRTVRVTYGFEGENREKADFEIADFKELLSIVK